MEPIKISDNPVTGLKRAIRIKQISYIDFDLKEAKVTWEEIILNNNDEPISHPSINKRQVISILSNVNDVTETGIVIDEEESVEDHTARIDAMKENSYPEFDFYINVVINMPAIGQAILLLDSFNRFDKA